MGTAGDTKDHQLPSPHGMWISIIQPRACQPPKHLHLLVQVLRFFAYFEESVPDSAEELLRIRRVEVRYHLEDDSMQLVEPRGDGNTGLQEVGERVHARMHVCWRGRNRV